MQCALLVNRCRAYITIYIYSVWLAADDKSNKECTHGERKWGGGREWWSTKKQYKYTHTRTHIRFLGETQSLNRRFLVLYVRLHNSFSPKAS